MKQALKKLSTFTLALSMMTPMALMAQKEENKEVKEKKDVEQIIITRKGDNDEKVTIELNGDKIIVNGKEIKANDENVTVNRMKVKELSALSRYPNTRVFKTDGMTFFSEDANRAMLGVVTEKTDDGLEIQDVTKESAAEKAGLKVGDYITKVNDKNVDSPDQLSEAIKKHKPGDKVTISYIRDKKEQKATAELTKWRGVNAWSLGKDHNFKMDMGDMDFKNMMPKIQAVPRTPQSWNWAGGGPKLGLSIQDTDDGKGVKVIEVDEESNAAKAGIKENDVITEVDGKAVNSADEMAKSIRESKEKVSVMLKLQRNGKTQNVEVKMPRRIKTVDL